MKDWKVEEEIEINLVGKKTEKRKNKQIHDAGIKTISEHRWQGVDPETSGTVLTSLCSGSLVLPANCIHSMITTICLKIFNISNTKEEGTATKMLKAIPLVSMRCYQTSKKTLLSRLHPQGHS